MSITHLPNRRGRPLDNAKMVPEAARATAPTTYLDPVSDVPRELKEAFAGFYEIEREVGTGGMATVYRARDLKHERTVAIKILRPELASVLGGGRFPREIKIVAQLSHPHILPLHDSGEAAGFLYYVTPYVEGGGLFGFNLELTPDGSRIVVLTTPTDNMLVTVNVAPLLQQD